MRDHVLSRPHTLPPDYLTHYLMLRLGHEERPIGEAAEVEQIAEDTWKAVVGEWSFDPANREFDRRVFHRVYETVLSGSVLFLLPKESYSEGANQ